MKSFSHKLYVTLMRDSKKLSDQYLIDCGLRQKEEKVKKTPIIEEEKEVLDTITPKTKEKTVEVKKIENKDKTLDIEVLREQYFEKFGKKSHPMAKAETLIKKLEQA